MDYLPRSAWGAAAPTWNPGRVSPAQGIFLHYNGPAVSPAVLAGDYESVAAFLRSTQRYHQQTQKWPDIAYSWCVDSVGRIWELRGWDVAGAHTLNHNWTSHAIFLPLGGDQVPTPEQIESCRRVIAEANKRYGKQFVKGHREAPNSTSCPGEPVMALIRANAFSPEVNAPPAKPPAPSPAPQPPAPPAGVDPTVKTIIMRNRVTGTISVFYQGTPFRVDLTSIDDVNRFKFFGAEDRGNQDPWFWKISSAVKTG